MKLPVLKRKSVLAPIVLVAGIAFVACFSQFPAIQNELTCAHNYPDKFQIALCRVAGWNSIDCGAKAFQYPGQRNEKPTDVDRCALNALEYNRPFRFQRIVYGTDNQWYEGIAMNSAGQVFFLSGGWGMGGESVVGVKRCTVLSIYEIESGKFMYCQGTFTP